MVFLLNTSLDYRLDASCSGGIDVSMLQQAVAKINGKLDTEASGNVVQETVSVSSCVSNHSCSSAEVLHYKYAAG